MRISPAFRGGFVERWLSPPLRGSWRGACLILVLSSIGSYVEVTAQKYAAPLVVADTATSHTDSCIFYSVGDFAQGGIIFWVDETRQHGLVCAKVDQSSKISWSAGTHTRTMAIGDGPFAGEANTIIIISNQGLGDTKPYAASLCNELQITENGKTYGDWYLPSREELNLMYLNRYVIDSTAIANGGERFYRGGLNENRNSYWSSTDFNYRTPNIDLKIDWDHGAYKHNFTRGDKDSQIRAKKYLLFSVRAVRAF